MVPETLRVHSRASKPVSIQVSGGRETDPTTGLPQVSNEVFAEAVRSAIVSAHLFPEVVDGQSAPYRLTVNLISLQQPLIGYRFTVTMEAGWELREVHADRTMWKKGVTSSYAATMGDAFVGATRLRLATEGAARENIRQALEQVGKLDFAEVSPNRPAQAAAPTNRAEGIVEAERPIKASELSSLRNQAASMIAPFTLEECRRGGVAPGSSANQSLTLGNTVQTSVNRTRTEGENTSTISVFAKTVSGEVSVVEVYLADRELTYNDYLHGKVGSVVLRLRDLDDDPKNPFGFREVSIIDDGLASRLTKGPSGGWALTKVRVAQ
jgi:hypothetical protein